MTPELLELALTQVRLCALAWGPSDGPLVSDFLRR